MVKKCITRGIFILQNGIYAMTGCDNVLHPLRLPISDGKIKPKI